PRAMNADALANVVTPLFTAATLGGDELARYRVEHRELPAGLKKALGGAVTRNNSVNTNVFYVVAVGDENVFAHYFRYKTSNSWTAAVELYTADGDKLGEAEIDGSDVSWTFA